MRQARWIWLLVLVLVGLSRLAWPATSEKTSLKPLWSIEQETSATDAVAAGGRLFLALSDRVIAYQTKTGRTLWSVELPAPRSLSADDKRVWAALDGKIVVLTAKTGERIAEKDLPAGETILAPAPILDRLPAQHGAGSLLLDADSLETLYQSAEPLFGEYAAMLRQTGYWKDRIDPAREQVFFLTPGELTAVSLETGQPNYTVASEDQPIGRPTVYQDLVLVRGAESLSCHRTRDGELLWRSELTSSAATYPLMIAQREDYPVKRTLPWYLSFWRWLKALFGFGDPATLLLQTGDGLAFHLTQRAKVKYFYPVPDDPRPLADVEGDAYWTYIFTDERDGQVKSVLQRMNKTSRQLYGRQAIPGRATGMFVMGRKWLFAEMAPGILAGLDQDECDLKRTYERPGDHLIGLFTQDKTMLAVFGQGHIAAFNRY